ncbi:MAG: hypothetical protein RLZ47_819 [Bacteroidota bacterium]|jgi:glycosyltransferase involved in cell wall biosynthesis
MIQAIVITPVKNSIETTLETIRAIANSSIRVKHIVYNDFSTEETKKALEAAKNKDVFELIHLEEITNHPSPNYRLVLQDAQQKAIQENLPLIIVESDVRVQSDTLEKMVELSKNQPEVGMIGAVTVDEYGLVNFPYLKFKKEKNQIINTKRSLSFCCTLLNTPFLNAYSFQHLDDTKDWYDVSISLKSVELGFLNFVLMNTPVLHKPHGSRPWKLMKYKNPIKYYLQKFLNRRDKI